MGCNPKADRPKSVYLEFLEPSLVHFQFLEETRSLSNLCVVAISCHPLFCRQTKVETHASLHVVRFPDTPVLW